MAISVAPCECGSAIIAVTAIAAQATTRPQRRPIHAVVSMIGVSISPTLTCKASSPITQPQAKTTSASHPLGIARFHKGLAPLR